MKYFLILLCFICAEMHLIQAQSPPANLNGSVDSLFAEWNSNTPGCVIGIVRNDSLLYAKGYGMANLEYDTPNQPTVLYDVGSVSKQFTAYCIVLLAQQHKLNLNDDIHKYINWIGIKDKITIQNLLNHTSGIRDYFQLLAIAGKNQDDAFTQETAIHILSKQQTLNNKPGEKYLYSNSNYLILAEIIKRVSGRTLRQFADSAIFQPLKMTSAYFSDDYTEVQKNRAYSYHTSDTGYYTKSFATDADVGPGNLFCNIEDMAKWVANFYTTSPGNAAAIKILTQKGSLNNGSEISYAGGINVGDYRGWTMYEHEGESAAFSSCVSIFPDLKTGIIVFANTSSVNAQGKNFAIADLFLQNKSKDPVPVPVASKYEGADLISRRSAIRQYIGKYIADDGTAINFARTDNRFYTVQNSDTALLVSGYKDTLFQASSVPKKFVFFTSSSGAKLVDEYWSQHSRRLYLANKDSAFLSQKPGIYTGTYYCPELACIYTISIRNQQLMLSSNLHDATPVWFDGKDDLFTDFDWMAHLHIKRNKQQQVTGFEVNSNRVLKMRFNKIKIRVL